MSDNTETMMNQSVVAQIRTPTNDEITRIRELWSALKQASLPASTDIGVELRTYLSHSVRIIGTIAGLHPVTGKSALPGQFRCR
jgi:hypothetical protein